ncbi:MAG: hypothetical protein ACK5SX_04395 [Sandaracinobacter sp.]
MTGVQPTGAPDVIELQLAGSRPAGRRGQRFHLPQAAGPAAAERGVRTPASRFRDVDDRVAEGPGVPDPVAGMMALMPTLAPVGQAEAAPIFAADAPMAAGARGVVAADAPPAEATGPVAADGTAGAARAVPQAAAQVAQAAQMPGRPGQPEGAGGRTPQPDRAAAPVPAAERGLEMATDSASAGGPQADAGARPNATQAQPGQVPRGNRQPAAAAAAGDRTASPSAPATPEARRAASTGQAGGQQPPAFALEVVTTRNSAGEAGRTAEAAGSHQPPTAEQAAPADVMVGHSDASGGGRLDVRIAAATTELRDRLRAATDELRAELAQIGTEVDAIRVELRADMMADGERQRSGEGGSAGFERGFLRAGELDAAAGSDVRDGALQGMFSDSGAQADTARSEPWQDGSLEAEDGGGGSADQGRAGRGQPGQGDDPADRREAGLVRLMLAPSVAPATDGTDFTWGSGGDAAGSARRIDRYA